MRKLLSAIISSPLRGRLCGLLFALLATTTLWAYDFQVGDLYYNITSEYSSIVEVTYHENYAGLTSVTIPETVTYNGTTYTVNGIGRRAFYKCPSLISVVIGNGIARIREQAFAYCSSLTSITLPYSITGIETWAFANCSSLTSITLSDNISSIGVDAFYGCYIEKSKFINNSSCTSHNNWGVILCDAEIDGLMILDNRVIKCRKYVTSAIIPEGIVSIGNTAFSACTNLTSVTIPNTVTSIGSAAFAYCSSLTSITIPNSVTSIEKSVFADCSSLNSIIIPESVTSIGDEAFYNCSSLTSINLSENIVFVGGSDAFYNTPWYNNLPDGIIYIGKVLYKYKGTISSNTSIEIKEGIISITSGAFYNQYGLTSIQIPNSITSIGVEAFRKCTSLTSLTIPKNVTTIGARAFYECSALKTIYTLPMVPPELECCNNFDGRYIKNIIVSLSSFMEYYQQWPGYDDFITVDEHIDMSLSLLNPTQTTITVHANVSDLRGTIDMGEHMIQWCVGDTIDSNINRVYFGSGKCSIATTITNLSPNTQYAFRIMYAIRDKSYTAYIKGVTQTVITSPVVLSEPTLQTTGQTYIEVQTSSAYGDATLVEEVVEVATSKYNTPEQRVNVAGRSNVIINNLMPDTKYYFRSVLTTQEAGTMQSEWYEATTEEITLATGDADGISNSSAFLHGTIDCDTMSRTEIGFEWKRSDAPSTVKPQRLLVVDRVDENLIFRLEGLSSDRYYDFRTFCLYNGKEYYGEWVGFLTSDKDILIPPSVQTREAEITDLGVLMKGFVVAGTEVILQRGFECWREESDQVATTVAEGAIMSSYIPEVWSYTTYKYRAYAKTPAGTTYGETLEVTTEYIATNIADIIVNASSNSAQVTWTMVEQADYYILTLYSDESMTEVIGVYTVDKNGNVTQKRVASATQSLVTCELTELLPETNYYFAVKAYNSADQMVAEENGAFATTQIPTSVENTHTQSPMTNCKKILRDGQLLILRDGKTYNVMGVIVE